MDKYQCHKLKPVVEPCSASDSIMVAVDLAVILWRSRLSMFGALLISMDKYSCPKGKAIVEPSVRSGGRVRSAEHLAIAESLFLVILPGKSTLIWVHSP